MRHQEIFDSDPQSEMDLGQPKQNAIQFPVTLAETWHRRPFDSDAGCGALAGLRFSARCRPTPSRSRSRQLRRRAPSSRHAPIGPQ